MRATTEQVDAGILQLQQQARNLIGQLVEERAMSTNSGRMARAIVILEQNSQPRPAALGDTRGIGKPAGFGSADERVLEKTLLVWHRKLLNYLVSVVPDVRESPWSGQ